LRLDPDSRRLTSLDGRPIVLRDRLFDALLYLIEHAGRVVEKSELMAAPWPNTVVEENNLNQTISRLRRALDDDRQSPRFIATVTRRGYQFIAEVRTVAPAHDSRGAAANGAVNGDRDEAAAARAVATAFIAGPRGASRLRFGATRRALGFAVTLALAGVLLALYWLTDNAEPLAVAPAYAGLSLADSELVSDFAGSHSQPTLSPSGRMMAFASTASGSSQIWIKSLTGSDPIQVTDGDRPARWPSWSLRDDSILFEREAPDGRRSIWSVGAFGPGEPRLVVEHGEMPSLAWDGESFVYAIGAEVWIADANGGGHRRVERVQVAAARALGREDEPAAVGREHRVVVERGIVGQTPRRFARPLVEKDVLVRRTDRRAIHLSRLAISATGVGRRRAAATLRLPGARRPIMFSGAPQL
jgi:DNA-binding winged helix-turn-helix (wHTH) protein